MDKNIGKDKFDEMAQTQLFEELSRQMIIWLRRNYHPHAKIIIDCERAEVVEGAKLYDFKTEKENDLERRNTDVESR